METMKFALHVITGAGFGVPINWDTSSDTVEAPHTLSFKNAVTTVLHHLFPIMLVPRRLWKLPFDTMRRASEGYYEFGNYMRELLEREKALGKESDGQNLMAALVKHSSEGEAGSNALLSDQEIIGNTFIFLLAGHETTYLLSYLS
jgi:cytochrome P450